MSLAAVLTAWLAAPWTGCDRDPVTPPAARPPERAPHGNAPNDLIDGGMIMLPTSRRLG